MNERHFAEIEKTLLFISEARERAERAARTIATDHADAHLVNALHEAERELLALHRKLMQSTYFAVPKEELSTLSRKAGERGLAGRLRRLDAVSDELGLSVAGLFAGIGGIELGLHQAGHSSALLCEIDEGASHVLRAHFPGVEVAADIRQLESLPDVQVVAAGFPCQDLSQAGRTAGITGRNSGLVEEVFRLVEGMRTEPQWLLLENVPFMLQLDRGEAMRYLTSRLRELGFAWAYRVVDTRAFGLPQRRQRVLLLASRKNDPREVLFHGDAGEPETPSADGLACGFYWTEGVRGLGWAVDAIPTLKGGSTIGIPSPPAIRLANGEIVTPHIADAERLQGFAPGWTEPAIQTKESRRRGMAHQWKLVGNAVSVPVAKWIGERLRDPRPYEGADDELLASEAPWPKAAWGVGADVRRAKLSLWPSREVREHLADFLEFEPAPLSLRAAEGFLRRARTSSLRFPDGLLDDVAEHIDGMRAQAVAA